MVGGRVVGVMGGVLGYHVGLLLLSEKVWEISGLLGGRGGEFGSEGFGSEGGGVVGDPLGSIPGRRGIDQ